MIRKLIILVIVCWTFNAMAESINLSLVPDVAIYNRTTRIDGVTLSIWGENETHGIAFGIVNGMTGSSEGASIGFVNYSKGYFKGFQWGAVNFAEKMDGFQLGFVNFMKDTNTGFQVGFINIIQSNQQFFSEFPIRLAPAFVFANWRFL